MYVCVVFSPEVDLRSVVLEGRGRFVGPLQRGGGVDEVARVSSLARIRCDIACGCVLG